MNNIEAPESSEQNIKKSIRNTHCQTSDFLMQLFKASSMIVFATILQCCVALTVDACTAKCKQIRGRLNCLNPCFTPGEYEYKTIQGHLKNPCSQKAKYWRAYYQSVGMAVTEFQQCFQGQSQSQRSSIKTDCIITDELRSLDTMSRCRAVKLDLVCSDVVDKMTFAEIKQLKSDAEYHC